MITCIAILACGFISVGWLCITIIGAIINAVSTLFRKDGKCINSGQLVEDCDNNNEWGML